MEQTLLDFFTKSRDLIFHNRLRTQIKSQGASPKKLLSYPENNFQLTVDRRHDFPLDFPPEWSQQPQKVLVIEFFVCAKAQSQKFLVEQWIFEIHDGSFEKVHDTVDSANTLYQRLSVLMRSISLFTVTLPVYQKLVRGSNNALSQSCTIEYSVNYNKETLSTWPTVTEDSDVMDYSSSDFVLPGRVFTFKLRYCKSLDFLNMGLEPVCENEKVEEIVQWRKASCAKKAFPDNSSKTDVNTFPCMNTPEEYKDQCLSTEMEDASSYRRMNSAVSEPRVWDMRKFIDDHTYSMCSLESGAFGEGDIFLYEDDEEVTEILCWKDAAMKNSSPTKIDFQQNDTSKSVGVSMLRKMSEDQERIKRKISFNVTSMEKITEHTKDDEMAELLKTIEGLKILVNREEKDEVKKNKDDKKMDTNRKGLRFESVKKEKREVDVELSMNGLRDLYLKIKNVDTTM